MIATQINQNLQIGGMNSIKEKKLFWRTILYED